MADKKGAAFLPGSKRTAVVSEDHAAAPAGKSKKGKGGMKRPALANISNAAPQGKRTRMAKAKAAAAAEVAAEVAAATAAFAAESAVEEAPVAAVEAPVAAVAAATPVVEATTAPSTALVAPQAAAAGPGSAVAVLPPVAPVRNIDAEIVNDISCFVEYVSDVFSYLRELESAHNVSASYMADTQPDVTPTMRAILVDWLVEVAEEYRLQPETLFICVVYIDRCLTMFPVTRSRLQLLGCSCMLLASKFEEVYAPAVDEFVYISDNTYTREEILQMESVALNHLGFRLSVATSKQFLSRFIPAADSSEVEKSLINYFAELILQEYSFVKYKSSHQAAAAVLCARLTLNTKPAWTPTLEHYTGYKMADLMDCCMEIADVHRRAATNNLQAVREKYSAPARHSVSTIVPPLTEAQCTELLEMH